MPCRHDYGIYLFSWGFKSLIFRDFSFFLHSRLKFAMRISLALCRIVQAIPKEGDKKNWGFIMHKLIFTVTPLPVHVCWK